MEYDVGIVNEFFIKFYIFIKPLYDGGEIKINN